MTPPIHPFGENPRLAVLCANPVDRIAIADLARMADYTLLDEWSLPRAFAPDAPAIGPNPDTLYADLGSETEMSATELSDLVGYCLRIGAKMVISTDLDCLDDRIADLPLDQCQIVVGKDPVELLLALNVARGTRTMSRVADSAKPYEAEALDRISNELAHYARALSRIARAEGDGGIAPDHLADKKAAYRGPPPSPFLPMGRNETETSLDPTAIRELIRLRRLRERFFDASLFADPAWDMLLDLMAARLEGKKVSVSSLCIAAAVPATTALRWIKSMTDAGYMERRADPTDARRIYIELGEEAARKMAEYLRQRLDSSVR